MPRMRGSVPWTEGGALVLSEKWPFALGVGDGSRARVHEEAASHQETFWLLPLSDHWETRSSLNKAWREVHQPLVAGEWFF